MTNNIQVNQPRFGSLEVGQTAQTQCQGVVDGSKKRLSKAIIVKGKKTLRIPSWFLPKAELAEVFCESVLQDWKSHLNCVTKNWNSCQKGGRVVHSWNVPAGIPGDWTGSLRSSDRKLALMECQHWVEGWQEKGREVSCTPPPQKHKRRHTHTSCSPPNMNMVVCRLQQGCKHISSGMLLVDGG